ncbi:hypothetical protein Bca4012_082900 [Brassica carinata]
MTLLDFLYHNFMINKPFSAVKVKEVECKHRERQQSDSAAQHKKVKDLESKLKESEGYSLVYCNRRLKVCEKVLFLVQIKELKVRLREQELHIQRMAATREFSDVASATPNEVKITCIKEDTFGSENAESSNVLRTSNRLKTSTQRNDSLNLNEVTSKNRVSCQSSNLSKMTYINPLLFRAEGQPSVSSCLDEFSAPDPSSSMPLGKIENSYLKIWKDLT